VSKDARGIKAEPDGPHFRIRKKESIRRMGKHIEPRAQPPWMGIGDWGLWTGDWG